MSLLDIPLTTANWFYSVGYMSLVVGITLTVISAIILSWSSGIRDRFASIEMAGARASTEMSRSAIATANAMAAQANERFAELSVEAEQEHRQVLQMQTKFAWRELTTEQSSALTEALSSRPGAVDVRWISGDPESLYYANQIAVVFSHAGWKISAEAVTIPSAVSLGLTIPNTLFPNLDYVRNAFRSALVAFQVNDGRLQGMAFGVPARDTDLVVFVGSKPVPAL